MATKVTKDLYHELTVVTWNLAGVNSNAFEFKLNLKDARFNDAAKFGDDLSELNKKLTDSHTHASDYKDDAWVKKMSQTYRSLLKPLQDILQKEENIDSSNVKKGTAQALKDYLSTDVGDRVLNSMLDEAKHGNSCFSKADMEFKARSWSFTNLRPSNVEAFMKSCSKVSKDAENDWWRLWIRDLAHTEAFQKHDKVFDKLMDHFVSLAVFDILLYHGTRFTLVVGKYNLVRLTKQLKGFIDSMNVDVEQKAKGISSALDWVVKAYDPDIISIQENNKFWQKLATFKKFWTELTQQYQIYDPRTINNPQQVVQLLIKKSYKLDKEATDKVPSQVKKKEFLARVRAELKSKTDFTDKILDEQVKKVAVVVDSTWVPAVFTTSKGTRVLACAAHGNSKGTDNRAIVAVTQLLSEDLDADVVLGMDANSNNVCKDKDVKHGAGSRRKFNEFVETYHELKSCYPSKEIEEKTPVDKSCKYHTVRKERTYLQMQIKKSNKLDQSLKDWVITNYDVTNTVRVNKFKGKRTWSEAEDKGSIWDAKSCMPNSMCPSDHCMLISHLKLNTKKEKKLPVVDAKVAANSSKVSDSCTGACSTRTTSA